MDERNVGAEGQPVRREDLEVTLAVRRDLGVDTDQAVIEEFLDRLGSAIDERVGARMNACTSAMAQPGHCDRSPSTRLGIVSILAGIPITLFALTPTMHSVVGNIIAAAVSWGATAAVNLAYTRGNW